jgi:hypothetical protein
MFLCRYLFYMTNPGEGFNLRRDVYMRIAVMVSMLFNFFYLTKTTAKSWSVRDKFSQVHFLL